MHEHHKSSLLLVENQHWRRGMPQKYLLFGLVVICFTILLLTRWFVIRYVNYSAGREILSWWHS